MKILLTSLNSKYIHSNLALKYLYAVLQRDGYSPELREFTINNSDDYIYGELLRGDYDIVCFSCYIWNIEKTLYLAENLKKARKETAILLGGPEVTWRAVEIMKKHLAVDYILSGEGEENLAKFFTCLSKTGEGVCDYFHVKGLHYRQDGKIYVNPPPQPVDFNQVPFPFLSLVSEDDKIMYYESVRGCPFSCSYCLSSIEKGIRPLPIDRVKEDLSYFIYKGVKQVKFVDRTFNYNNERSLSIVKYLMEADQGITNFHFEMCGDLISQEMLRLLSMARPGLFQLEIGVQTTNEKTLRAINRPCDLEKLAQNVSALIELGNIHLHLDLIAGLPHEDYHSFANSFNAVYSLKPDMLQLGFLKLLPGTPILKEVEEHSYIYRRKAPYELISNLYISSKELAHLKMVEKLLNLYYNRGGFQNTLDYFAYKKHKSPFLFYEDLSDFYYRKGFQHRSHNKETLYKILYHYGVEKDKNNTDNLIELLEGDMKASLNPEAVRKFMKTGWVIEE